MKTFQEFLEESSTPERGRRRLSSRGPSSYGDLIKQRTDNSDRVAARKAGFRRRPGEVPNKYPFERNKVTASRNSDHHRTTIETDKNQVDYAIDNTYPKMYFDSNRGVNRTVHRVSDMRQIRRNLGGDRTPRRVHTVNVQAMDDTIEKNDPKNLIARSKGFNKELHFAHDEVSKKAKPGDIISVTAVAAMPNEDENTGRKKREKIYSKKFGLKFNPKTSTAIKRV